MRQTPGGVPPDRRILPTELAALAAGVSEATIRKWASRGKITRYGTTRRALYDLDELIKLVTAQTDPSEVRHHHGDH